MQMLREPDNWQLNDLRLSHAKIMRDGAAALEGGDMFAYEALHHSEFIFHVFGGGDIQGDYVGIPALKNLHEKFREKVGGEKFSLEVHDSLSTAAHGIWLIQFFPDREKSRDDHDTAYVVCEFHEGLISQAWFVFWPKKELFSPLSSDGHAADGRTLERVLSKAC